MPVNFTWGVALSLFVEVEKKCVLSNRHGKTRLLSGDGMKVPFLVSGLGMEA